MGEACSDLIRSNSMWDILHPKKNTPKLMTTDEATATYMECCLFRQFDDWDYYKNRMEKLKKLFQIR